MSSCPVLSSWGNDFRKFRTQKLLIVSSSRNFCLSELAFGSIRYLGVKCAYRDAYWTLWEKKIAEVTKFRELFGILGWNSVNYQRGSAPFLLMPQRRGGMSRDESFLTLFRAGTIWLEKQYDTPEKCNSVCRGDPHKSITTMVRHLTSLIPWCPELTSFRHSAWKEDIAIYLIFQICQRNNVPRKDFARHFLVAISSYYPIVVVMLRVWRNCSGSTGDLISTTSSGHRKGASSDFRILAGSTKGLALKVAGMNFFIHEATVV